VKRVAQVQRNYRLFNVRNFLWKTLCNVFRIKIRKNFQIRYWKRSFWT